MHVRGLYLDSQSPVLGTPATRAAATAQAPADGKAEAAPEPAPVVYANFVTSLDGRIAVGEAEREAHVPPSLTTTPDWRLFQELQAHADCFITHGGYLRALADERLSDILQVGLRDDAADLLAWRHARGLTAQPAIVVASRSLSFPLPPSVRRHGQRMIVVTTRDAPPQGVARLRAAGVEVMLSKDARRVSGTALVAAVRALGCRRAYLEAGPWVLEGMLRDALLRRLYLTISHRLIGGEAFHTLVAGGLLGEAGRLRLASLYLAPDAGGGEGQFYASFDAPAPGTQG